MRRKEYWMFVLFNMIVAFLFGFVCGLIGIPELANLYSLAVLLPMLWGFEERNDGESGWFR